MCSLRVCLSVCVGAEKLQPVQVVPQRIEAVNGSTVDMGCSVVVNISSNRTACGSCEEPSASYLVDGASPAINTSSYNWAAELVTVRRSDAIPGKIDFPHVLLSFGFDMPVLPSSIELEVFHCPDWNIAAPFIDVHANDNADLVFRTLTDTPRYGGSLVSQQSCDALSNVTIDIDQGKQFHSVWYLIVSLDRDEFYDWVHVGEVRFMEVSKANYSSPICGDTTASSSLNITSTLGELPTLSPSLTLTLTRTEVGPSISLTTIVKPSDFGVPASLNITASPSVTPTSTKHTSLPSKKPSKKPDPTSDLPPSTKLPLLYFFIAGGAALVLCVFLLVVALCCTVICRRSSVRHKKVIMTVDDGVEEIFPKVQVPLPPTPTDPPHTNGHLLSITNPIQLALDDDPRPPDTYEQRSSALYEAIPANQSLAVPGGSTDASSAHSDTPTLGAAGRSACDGAGADTGGTEDQPLLSGSNMETQDVYVPMLPCWHPASQDVEGMLTQRFIVNEGIYSESIGPSDFAPTEEGAGSGGGFLPPVYPTPNFMPECLKPTIEVSGDNIKETGELRIGQFGQTSQARTLDLSLRDIGLSKTDNNRNLSLLVVVKKFCPRSSQVHLEREAFNRESKFMSSLRHPNVLRFLGVCYDDPPFIMMEYMEEGDLNLFLQKYSEIVPMVTPSSKSEITTSTLVYVASQIANAMRYLAEFKFIHRDLATRNCFIGANTIIKVGDLGVDMTQYSSHYYSIRTNTLMPIRWMATECFSGKYSEKSDVWAFGVTMWELFTLAKQLPYPHLSDEEVIRSIVGKELAHLPSNPQACPQPVFDIIERCWVMDMKQRATFAELHKLLQMHL